MEGAKDRVEGIGIQCSVLLVRALSKYLLEFIIQTF